MRRPFLISVLLSVLLLTFYGFQSRIHSHAAQQGRLPDIAGAEIVLYYSPSCDACTSIRRFLDAKLKAYPQTRYVAVDNTLPGAAGQRAWFNAHYHVTVSQAEAVPALFTKQGCYIGYHEIDQHLWDALAAQQSAVSRH